MLKQLMISFFSMLLSSKRPNGRDWKMEMIVRMIRNSNAKGESNLVDFMRVQLEAGVITDDVSNADMNELTIAGVPCLQFDAKNASSDPETIVVYLHGGAYVAGSPNSHKSFTAKLAVGANARVISVDYRLAPEHRFPAAFDDCLAVFKEVRARYPNLHLVLAGDSAGGGLSVAVALALAGSTDAPDKTVLISPWVEPTADSGTMISNLPHDLFSDNMLTPSYQHYMNGADEFDTRVNFVNADLSGLGKCLVQYGGSELFYDQIHQFCQRAEASGVDIEHESFDGQAHVFPMLLPGSDAAKRAVQKMYAFVRAA